MKSLSEIQSFMSLELLEITFGQVDLLANALWDKALISELGLDSLDYASLMVSVEEWLSVKVPEGNVDWSSLKSARQLAEFLHDLQG